MDTNYTNDFNRAWLLLGTNMGDRSKNLENTLRLIELRCGKIVHRSGIYETDAWGKQDQPAFYNQAIEIATELPAGQLMQTVLDIETGLGRERKEKFGPRLIDIDILLYNAKIINKPHLVIPHPELQNRRFALEPLNEIATELLHPVFKKTILQLLKDCADQLAVRKLKV